MKWQKIVGLLLCFVMAFVAESLTNGVYAQPPTDIRDSLTGHGHALLIGVSKYDNSAWPELSSVPGDIDDLAKGLAPHFATIETLIDPTSDTLRSKLREFMTSRWNQPDERLLLYYAGHGFTAYNDNSRIYTGYITGRDTPACLGSNCNSAIGSAIPFNNIDALNRETRVRQVINLFDSCFSGLLVVKGPEDADATHYAADRAREEMRKPIRYYITAGGPTEAVPADSPFAALILKGLNGPADFWKDGFISAEELGIYLQRNVPIYARRSLHPQRSAIVDETARLSSGQFMFLTGLERTVPPNNPASVNMNTTIVEQAQAAMTRQDYVAAARLFRIAADQGNAIGQANLGFLYNQGRGGLMRDDREAARLYRLAADQGQATAQANLGVFYRDGLGGLTNDDREALRLFRLSTDQGDAGGQVNLGFLYDNGRGGLTKDDREAALLYRLAANQGDATAQANLGIFYRDGRGGLAKNDREAARLFRLSADQGTAGGQVALGRLYEGGRGGLPKDDYEAARLYRLAADQGQATAQANLGVFYRDGLGGLTNDDREALRLFRLSTDQGDAVGQVNLGVFYRDGQGGLINDDREAARLFRLSADQGNADGKVNLGFFYENGRGDLAKDAHKAISLYKQAALSGNDFAQRRLKNLGETW